jgi:hypothetical protein
MEEKVKAALEKNFTDGEIARIGKFLDRGFCVGGQIVVSSIFIYAREKNISVARVLKECEKEWTRNWDMQHPDIKGSADAPGGASRENRISLINIYSALGLELPEAAEKSKVPTKAIVVKTNNSTYHFGEADKSGVRSIIRDNEPLDFNRCIILSLAVGRSMEMKDFKGPVSKWYTSPVVSIT